MSLFGSMVKLLGSRRQGAAPPTRRLPGVEQLEERSLLSITLGPVIRLGQVPTSATFAARLSPSDPRALQVSADGGTTFADVGALPEGSEAGRGAFVLTGPAHGSHARYVLVLVTDFNRDGAPDLAVNFGPSIEVLLGQPDGSFQFTFGLTGDGIAQPGMLAVGDFDRNGTADLLAVSRLGSGNQSVVSLIDGNGDGAFRTGENVVERPSKALGALESLGTPGELAGSVLWRAAGTATLLTGELTSASLELGLARSFRGADVIEPATRAAPADLPRDVDQTPARDVDGTPGPPGADPGVDGVSDPAGVQAAGARAAVGTVHTGDGRHADAFTQNGGLGPPGMDSFRVDGVVVEPPLTETPAAAVAEAGTGTPAAAVGAAAAARSNPTLPGPPSPGLEMGDSGVTALPAFTAAPLVGDPENPWANRDGAPDGIAVPDPSRTPGGSSAALAVIPAGVSPAADPADQPLSIRELSRLLAQALYLGSLKRSGPEAGTEAAAESLQPPGDTRLLVADLVQRSSEAFGRLVQGFYVLFLGRAAAAGEENGWVAMFLSGDSEEKVLSAFLSTAEFYNRAGALVGAGTGDERFIQSLYRLLLHRPATDAETSGWLSALPKLGRGGVAGQLLSSAEYRAQQVQSFYQELLRRPGAAAEVATWANSPFDLLTIRLFFEARPELLRGEERPART
jgi:hypothetical protein